jgi:hypothetical protein
MNMYLDECLTRERIHEARALAAQWAQVDQLRRGRLPVRVRAGLALIRLGRWMAHRPSHGAPHPRRVPA